MLILHINRVGESVTLPKEEFERLIENQKKGVFEPVEIVISTAGSFPEF